MYFLEINPNCGIFYPPDAMGSADYILSLDPSTSHAAFIDHIVEAALARARRRCEAKVTEVRPLGGEGLELSARGDMASAPGLRGQPSTLCPRPVAVGALSGDAWLRAVCHP